MTFTLIKMIHLKNIEPELYNLLQKQRGEMQFIIAELYSFIEIWYPYRLPGSRHAVVLPRSALTQKGERALFLDALSSSLESSHPKASQIFQIGSTFNLFNPLKITLYRHDIIKSKHSNRCGQCKDKTGKRSQFTGYEAIAELGGQEGVEGAI